jgi:DNA-binding CsgD family transcriptional regulator
MNLKEIDTLIQNNIITLYHSPQNVPVCWDAIDSLLHIVYCNLVYLSLCENIHNSGKDQKQAEPTVIQRWAKYSRSGHCNNTKSKNLLCEHKFTNSNSLDEICTINSLKGGSNETLIYSLENRGYIRFVFVDSPPSDKEQRAHRQVIFARVLPHLTGCFSQWLMNRQRLMKGKQLSKREMEVLYWIKEGKSTWKTAHILGLTENTIKFHLKNIFKKLGSTNRIQAVNTAISLGLM